MDPVMDELMISGKRFISSRRAAKEYHYHSDYIGQLIRSGKIAGQKVGHNWYVSAASLASYMRKKEEEDLNIKEASAVSHPAPTTKEEHAVAVAVPSIEVPPVSKPAAPVSSSRSVQNVAPLQNVQKDTIYEDYRMLTYLPEEEHADLKEKKSEKVSGHNGAPLSKEEGQSVPIKISLQPVFTIHPPASPLPAEKPLVLSDSNRSRSGKSKLALALIFMALALLAAGGSVALSMVPAELIFVQG